jgi:ParB family chromosome partitioning protein
LSALLSETQETTASEELREVDIDLIEPNNVQPRTRFDETQLEELAQSIKTNGVVQPILLRKTNGGRYQIVAGERRWRAAQRAGLQRIPSVIREIPDDKMLELALIENIQRQELNAIEEAYAYKRLIETFNLTQETVAQRVGRDRTFVTNYLRLLRLPEDIQQLVEESKLSKLRRRLGTQVHLIPNQTGQGGKIEVQYYNESDLQRIYEMIMGNQNMSDEI